MFDRSTAIHVPTRIEHDPCLVRRHHEGLVHPRPVEVNRLAPRQPVSSIGWASTSDFVSCLTAAGGEDR